MIAKVAQVFRKLFSLPLFEVLATTHFQVKHTQLSFGQYIIEFSIIILGCSQLKEVVVPNSNTYLTGIPPSSFYGNGMYVFRIYPCY